MTQVSNQVLFHIRWKNESIVVTQAEVDAQLPDAKLQAIAEGQFSRKMNLFGVHGRSHWKRVRENGLVLSRLNGANSHVIVLFSIFHDCQRTGEGEEKLHGPRSARFLVENRHLIPLNDTDFGLLRRACHGHTDDVNHDPDITVMTCWDADRLDLGRVGIVPHPKKLCTPEARDRRVIDWAYWRSINRI